MSKPLLQWALAGLLVLAGTQLRAQSAELTVDGAVRLAHQRLRADPQNGSARDLLEFALALDEGNSEAETLLTFSERGRKPPEPDLQVLDNGRTYANYLARQADKFERSSNSLSRAQGQLFYVAARTADGTNRDVFEALAKLEREGQKVDMEGAIDAYRTELQRRDERQAAKKTANSKEVQEFLARLDEVPVENFSFPANNPWDAINDLNRILSEHRLHVKPAAKSLVVSSNYHYSDGVPRYYGRLLPIDGDYQRIKNVTGLGALHFLCRAFKLGYRIDGQQVLLLDPDDPTSIHQPGLRISADKLLAAFDANSFRAREEFEGRTIEVEGQLSSFGRASRGRSYVSIDSGRIRLAYHRDEPIAKAIEKLKEEYDQAEAQRREHKRERRSASYYYEYDYKIDFTVRLVGQVDSYTSNRILLAEGEAVTWENKSRSVYGDD